MGMEFGLLDCSHIEDKDNDNDNDDDLSDFRLYLADFFRFYQTENIYHRKIHT